MILDELDLLNLESGQYETSNLLNVIHCDRVYHVAFVIGNVANLNRV